jgi:O-succinylbenzoate synthase
MLIRLYQYRLRVQSHHWTLREGLILQYGDGFGEIAPLPGFSRETLEQAREELLRILPDLSLATLPSVRFGITSAQSPLSSIRIPLAALSEPRPGFQTLKLKLGHLSIEEAISLVKQHYKQFRLRLDCNRAWTLPQALHFARHFQPTDFEYLEEPLQTFEELIAFSTQTHFPIALDEHISSDWSRIPSLKTLVIKPTLTGTIPPIPDSLNLVLSSSYESGLGLLHIAHLAQKLHPTIPVGLDTYRSFSEDLLTHPIDCSSGFFSWTASHPPIRLDKLSLLYSN